MDKVIEELFLDSVQNLIEKHTPNADITIKANISEITDNGEYYFIYNGKKQRCYNNLGFTLGIGEEVYITIPQGDLNLQKYIIGKEDTGREEAVKVLELEKQINVSQSFEYDGFNILKLDCGEGSPQVVGPLEIPFDEAETANSLSQKYDALLFSAEFLTNLFASVSGNYGLTLKVTGEEGKSETFTLDSSNMFGTIYNFNPPASQGILCDITDLGKVNSISVYLYQQGLNSNKYNGEIDNKKYEISVGKISFQFGFLTSGEKYNTIKLYSKEGEKYNYDYPNPNTKTLSAFIYKEKIENGLLRLEKYNYNVKEWELVLDRSLNNDFYKEILLLDNTKQNVDLEYPKTSYRVKLIQKQKMKDDEELENVLIVSDTYDFLNQANISDINTINNLQNYRIMGSQVDGVHYSYQNNGKIVTDKNSNNRTFTLAIQKKEDDKWFDITSEIQELNFSANLESSMIEKLEDNTYTIAEQYSQLNYNNTIYASFIYKGVKYKILKELIFGYQGIANSDYQLILIPDNKKLNLTNKNTMVSYKIVDNQGKQIDNFEVQENGRQWNAFLRDKDLIKNAETDDTGEAVSGVWDFVDKVYVVNTAAAIKLNLTCKINDKIYKMNAVESISYCNLEEPSNYYGCDRVEYLPNSTSANYYKQSYVYGETEFESYKINQDIIDSNDKYHDVVEIKPSNNIVVIIPVVYDYNTYSSSLVNNWNGEELTPNYFSKEEIPEVSEFSKTSPKISIGSKNSENKFSGIILGEETGITNNPRWGIYGYGNDALAYGFREDGTAFIGKNGSGRIQFDGNKGIIASDSWFDSNGNLLENPGSGLKIDLDEAYLKAVRNSSNDCVKISPGEQVFFEVSTNAANPWGGTGDITCCLKFNSNGLTEISAAKISGIWLDGTNNFLRGTLDIATTADDLTTRHASLSSIKEGDVVKGVFKGYGTSGDATNVGACVVSGDGAALKFLGSNNYVSVSSSSVNLNGNIYINGKTLKQYIQESV